ncbi:Glyoxylate reductase [Durusdinium trenchii]|uniref:Glyoxylate reductase n=1 Tax=Durusdinium trenchii TaxID=1381693 RepID=A0ABP0I9A3_9DINO
MPRNITILEQLPSLTLMQSSHYMHPRLSTIPATVTVAKYDVPWRSYGVEPIAEFVIAAAFQWTYHLASKQLQFCLLRFWRWRAGFLSHRLLSDSPPHFDGQNHGRPRVWKHW